MKPSVRLPTSLHEGSQGRPPAVSAARHLSNRELLTWVLEGCGGGGAQLAERFLRHFGNLRTLAQATRAELGRVPGARSEHALILEACLELGRRTVYAVSYTHLTLPTIYSV